MRARTAYVSLPDEYEYWVDEADVSIAFSSSPARLMGLSGRCGRRHSEGARGDAVQKRALNLGAAKRACMPRYCVTSFEYANRRAQ
eukprot:1183741-Prorocentrum_minimum.AAC.7